MKLAEDAIRTAARDNDRVARRLEALVADLAADIEWACSNGTDTPDAILMRRDMLQEVGTRAIRRLEATLNGDTRRRADIQAASDRARLIETHTVVRDLSTNLGLYLS